MNIFFSDNDKNMYVRCLAKQAVRYELTILSYCLMPNHIHLIVVPKERDSLALAIGEAHRRYTYRINQRNNIRGYLFQGRFYSCALNEKHAVAAIRYVERNPVRAGIVTNAWDYPWSSASYHVGLREIDPLVTTRNYFGLISNWKDLLNIEPDEIKILRSRIKTGRPCGDNEFVRKAELITGRILMRQKPGPKLDVDRKGGE